MVPHRRRNPRTATTYGTGEVIKEALERGFERIIVGLGGSATNDAGAGMGRRLGREIPGRTGQTPAKRRSRLVSAGENRRFRAWI